MLIMHHSQPFRAIWLVLFVTVCSQMLICDAKLEPGASCGNAKVI
jgi:hypothetical protein